MICEGLYFDAVGVEVVNAKACSTPGSYLAGAESCLALLYEDANDLDRHRN